MMNKDQEANGSKPGEATISRLPEKKDAAWYSMGDQTMNRLVEEHHRKRCQKKLDDMFGKGSSRSLCEALEDLEKASFDYDSTQLIARSITQLVEDLVKEMSRVEPRFAGARVRGIGSYFDGTRVSAFPDEFDFVIELDPRGLNIHKFDSTWMVEVNDDEHKDMWRAATCAKKDFVKHYCFCMSDFTYNAFLKREGGKVYMDKRKVFFPAFRQFFFDLVTRAICKIQLPEGLIFGEMFSPNFSGARLRGFCYTLLLEWQDGPDSPRYPVTVDLTPALPGPHTEKIGKFIHLITDGETGWQETTTAAETEQLRLVGRDSRWVKHLRILKLLIRQFLQWDVTKEMELDLYSMFGDLLNPSTERREGDADVPMEGGAEVPLDPATELNEGGAEVPLDPATELNEGGAEVPLDPATERNEGGAEVPLDPATERIEGGAEVPRYEIDEARIREVVRQSLKDGRLRIPEIWQQNYPPCGLAERIVTLWVMNKKLAGTEIACKHQLLHDLTEEENNLRKWRSYLHPVVAKAVGELTKPFCCIKSCYVKYVIMSELLQDQPSLKDTEGGYNLEWIHGQLQKLSKNMSGTFPHRLLPQKFRVTSLTGAVHGDVYQEYAKKLAQLFGDKIKDTSGK